MKGKRVSDNVTVDSWQNEENVLKKEKKLIKDLDFNS